MSIEVTLKRTSVPLWCSRRRRKPCRSGLPTIASSTFANAGGFVFHRAQESAGAHLLCLDEFPIDAPSSSIDHDTFFMAPTRLRAVRMRSSNAVLASRQRRSAAGQAVGTIWASSSPLSRNSSASPQSDGRPPVRLRKDGRRVRTVARAHHGSVTDARPPCHRDMFVPGSMPSQLSRRAAISRMTSSMVRQPA